ncbi:MAG: D-cysteine desulfhydrase family protein [Gammaproteobacteria bacterium]
MIEPPRISLASLPTPLQLLERLSEELGVRIWLKRDDLTDAVATGNKIRKLEYTIGQALAESADVLVTWGGVQSNHCRATAALAARLGLRAHLLLRGSQPGVADGNLLLDQLLGAEVTFLKLPDYQAMDREFDRLTEHYAALGLKTFRIPVGASDEIGLWGYINCAAELKRDFAAAGISPDAIISATGSGGTFAGLILGNALYELGTEIMAINVCDDETYFVNKVTEDFSAWRRRYEATLNPTELPIQVIDGYVGPGYGRATPAIFQTIAKLAQEEGIVLDPVYTGKAFHAMLHEIQTGRLQGMKDIVFIHTGGIFGLFPQKTELLEAI